MEICKASYFIKIYHSLFIRALFSLLLGNHDNSVTFNFTPENIKCRTQDFTCQNIRSFWLFIKILLSKTLRAYFF